MYQLVIGRLSEMEKQELTRLVRLIVNAITVGDVKADPSGVLNEIIQLLAMDGIIEER